jgi:hypothetical protein
LCRSSVLVFRSPRGDLGTGTCEHHPRDAHGWSLGLELRSKLANGPGVVHAGTRTGPPDKLLRLNGDPKGSQSAGQVGDEKANVSEPLLKHRNGKRWHRNRGLSITPGQWRNSGAPSAGDDSDLLARLAVSGVKVA